MDWERLPAPTTFDKARRREAYKRFARVVRGKQSKELLPLDEVRSRLRLFEQTYVGVRPIPVDAIVGSAGRSRDFDRDFLPRRPELRARWRRVEQAFPEGGFPPIVAYELNGRYFVVDGHHRVAIAKQRKIERIDAEVTRLVARFELPENADIGAIILAEQRRIFMDESGLERARPEANIDFSQPLGYVELWELVRVHGFHMMEETGRVWRREEVSGHWYDHVYLPTVEAIRREGLPDLQPGYTDGDRFLWVWQRRRALFPEHGGMTLEDTVRLARAEQQRRLPVRARQALKRLRVGEP